MSIVPAVVLAGQAHALTINPTFDNSFSGLADAATIEQSFDNAVQIFDTAINSSAVINIQVSWGGVGGQAMPGNALGASLDPLYINVPYSSVKSWLLGAAAAPGAPSALVTAAANLPASNSFSFSLPAAEAKGLGLVAANRSTDGYIGFGSGVSYTFTPGVVAPGTYDFTAIVQHEVEEVLGRISGISASGTTYLTPFDLFRYSAPFTPTTDYSTPAYFSINGGFGPLAIFNSQPTGDRGDLNNLTCDVQNAFLATGQDCYVQQNDLTELAALGYYAVAPGRTPTQWTGPGFAYVAQVLPIIDEVPEPASAGVLALAIGGLATARRFGAGKSGSGEQRNAKLM